MRAIEVTALGIEIDRCDGHTTAEVQHVQTLPEPHEVAKITGGPWPAPAVQIGAVRRSTYRVEGDVIGAERDITRRVSCMEGEHFGGACDELGDQRTVETHQPSVVVDIGAGVVEPSQRIVAQELDTELFEHAHRSVVNRLHPLGVDHLDRPVGIG